MDIKTHIPEKFQDCLNDIMAKRKLSASQLALMLGHKSKTTIQRILQGSGGLRCIGNVYKELCSCEEMQLTEAETERLHTAYDMELWGTDNYRARSEMWRLLRKGEERDVSMRLFCTDGSETTLRAFLNGFASPTEPADICTKEMEILMLSGCYPSVMEVMASLLQQMGSHVHIRQLFMLNGDVARTVRLIRNILPTLGYHTYEAFSVLQNDIIPDPAYSGTGTGKAMALRVQYSDGSVREFQILMQSETAGVLLEAPGIWNHWQQFTAMYFNNAAPLKATVPEIRDYISLLEYYADTERNREALIYKPDVCFYHIPTEILLHALKDSIAASADAETADAILQVLPKLRSTQEKRFQNMVNKRQHTYWVASREALLQFARTGVQNDHFFAMRPFTVEERHRVFRHLLDQEKNNPYSHMYLMREEDEDSFLDLEATCFVGLGLQLTSIGTDYCLSDGWTETLLEEESFCALYREFYMEELIAHHTQPPEAAVLLMEEILRMLETMPETDH